MGIGTYEAYHQRLLDMKPNVYLDGKKVDRSGDWMRGGLYVMKVCYDMANDPDFADVCTAKSHLTGETINRCTHIHQSKDDLLKKQLMTRLLCHHVGERHALLGIVAGRESVLALVVRIGVVEVAIDHHLPGDLHRVAVDGGED